jgi:c-di-GMP-binding flagellar brake protein YcgR
MPPTTAETTRPGLNTHVSLRLPCCTEGRSSRVEDVAGARLAVAAPEHPCQVGVPERGTPVQLQWVAANGVLQLEGRIVDTVRVPLYTWVVEPAGPTTRIQRRRFVRVPKTGLLVLESSAGQLLKATMINLSEGGLGCVIGAGTELWPGHVLETSINLGPDDALRVRAEVVWTRLGQSHLVEFGMRFLELTSREADRIRRSVFATQQRLHAQGRR